MAERRLDGKTVAILATDGFEEVELTQPREALEAAGATVRVVSLKPGEIQGLKHFDRGRKVPVDLVLEEAMSETFDALMLPGGAMNPDRLRTEPKVQAFVREFFRAGKPVAAICHAPWILIDAGVAEGRTLTSYRTIRRDLINAGAEVVDREVVVDEGLVTSRQPSDLPAFCAKMIEEFAKGRHEGQAHLFAEHEARPGGSAVNLM
ncbi:type 1 glutamine amidotransferase domain-containing protein [Caulobacter sp. 17J65-9]|uniref:type 1 glutamine amidotransferase domain-containing protein n=1 Tax=Caulobacter sp. 17J65-9 TaxID=2709382 RepID=UPI0013C57259|nr:type 1 glutamine amidotransferase domain-containing protein [Caulobacter sp. 17J65-9]NEX93833.1 type 1 glutamine amidotransferase [Caulobacter sp. 17J65-9]